MNKRKLFFPILLLTSVLSIFFTIFAAYGDGCDGCQRTAVLKDIMGLERNSFMTRLSERAISPCFHLQNYDGLPEGKPSEYYFTASYDTDLTDQIKSRLSISLYFEDGELIHQWDTESDRSSVTFHWHLQKMFINRTALFRKWVPLDITLLNDFEKRPYKCDINPEKEELFPGQQTEVKLSNIVDFEGRNSREFNRIVVQAVKGEIIGGTPLLSDPELKAFQIGKGDITFTYRAPDEENSQAAEDKIIVYNSCDILKKDEYPMPKTGLKDKIAEKTINLVHYEGFAILNYTYTNDSSYEYNHKDATVRLNLGKELRSLPGGGLHHLAIWYPITSVNIMSANAKNISHVWKGETKTGHSFKLYSPLPGSVIIVGLNTTTGKFDHVEGMGMDLYFKWSDGSDGGMGLEDEDPQVRKGDGVRVLKGSFTHGSGAKLDWTIYMRKRR